MSLDVNQDIYPAELTTAKLICVAGSTDLDTRVSTSNVGPVSVDLFAPGASIYSTTRTNGYASNNGTSFAAPYVAGVAALLLSECSTISVSRMRTVILGTVDTFSSLSGLCVTGGRLNAYRALSNVHNHTYSYVNTVHLGRCACGHVIPEEAHNFVKIGVNYVCSVCGYVTTNP